MHIKSEWELIARIKNLIDLKNLPHKNVVEGIGDDAAVFEIDDKRFALITTDISIENIHFKSKISSPAEIGYKAMTGNLSDIAAMGGTPRFAFISLGLPQKYSEEDVLSLYEGFIEAANPAGVKILGGDTSKSGELVINITVYGEVDKSSLVRRKGAKSGDKIYVTGNIGDSQAGLEILLSVDNALIAKHKELIMRHKKPHARCDIVYDIIEQYQPSAMIDISDGLLSDLRHICERSTCGFNLTEKKLPISEALTEYCNDINKAVDFALHSGEEYELLFTSGRLVEEKNNIKKIPVTCIGEIIDNGYFLIRDNQTIKVGIKGFDHFKMQE